MIDYLISEEKAERRAKLANPKASGKPPTLTFKKVPTPAPFSQTVNTKVFGAIQNLKKLKENPLYARFQTSDGRIGRLMTPRSANRTLIKTWKDTTVTLKVLGRPKKDVDGNPIQYAPGAPIKHQVIAVASDNDDIEAQLTGITIKLAEEYRTCKCNVVQLDGQATLENGTKMNLYHLKFKPHKKKSEVILEREED